MNLYLTADQVGIETGGGVVTANEADALQTVGDTWTWDRSTLQNVPLMEFEEKADPWVWDSRACTLLGGSVTPPLKLAHFYAGTFSRTVAALRERGCKVTYTAAAHSVEASRFAHTELGIPYDFPHLTDPEQWQRYLKGYLLADVLVCPSTHSADVMRSYGRTGPIEIIPHGCYLPDAPIQPQPERFTVGYLGSYGPDKGVRFLLEAWKKLDYKDAMLLLGGRDSQSPFVDALIQNFGGGNIERVGWLDNVGDFYNRCSLYVQPSVCLLPGSLVFSDRGPVPVESLSEADSVLVDAGVYRKVEKPLRNRYSGDMVSVRTTGVGLSTVMTPAHRVLVIRRGLETRQVEFGRKISAYKEAIRLNEEEGKGARRLSRSLGFPESMIKGWLHYGNKPEGRGANWSLCESVLQGSPEWMPVRKLEKGDVVLFPRSKTVVPVDRVSLPRKIVGMHGNGTKTIPSNMELDAEAMRFFGLYVAEGCAGDSSVTFCFHRKEKEFVEVVQRVAGRLGLNVCVYRHPKKKSMTARIESILLTEFMTKNFGRGSYNKSIPQWVMLLPDKQLKPFIRGMWNGDGSSWQFRRKVRGTNYSTVSRTLAYQLFAALVRIGHMPKLVFGPVTGNHAGGSSYFVSLNGNDGLDFAEDVLKIVVQAKRSIKGPWTYIDDDYYYMPVTDVSRIPYVGDVYNLEVQENHCYCAPFVVHNSEGFGIEILEAMAHGRSVLASTGAGASALIPHSWRFAPRDVNNLAFKIDMYRKYILPNVDLTIQGQWWRDEAEKYTWPKVRERYVAMWQKLLKGE